MRLTYCHFVCLEAKDKFKTAQDLFTLLIGVRNANRFTYPQLLHYHHAFTHPLDTNFYLKWINNEIFFTVTICFFKSNNRNLVSFKQE